MSKRRRKFTPEFQDEASHSTTRPEPGDLPQEANRRCNIFIFVLPDEWWSRLRVHLRVPRGGPRRGDLDMRRIVVGGWWMVRLLAGLTIMAALALAVPLGAAA